MDACTVFEFVFKPDTAKKYVGSRSLAQETQVSIFASLFLVWFYLIERYKRFALISVENSALILHLDRV